jgi:hypothetical protein
VLPATTDVGLAVFVIASGAEGVPSTVIFQPSIAALRAQLVPTLCE